MRKREMQRTRSIAEQRKFYNKIYEDTAKSSRKIANARLRKGLYKDLFEEFLVILNYSEMKYPNNTKIKFKWVGYEKQGDVLNYDGIIYRENEIIEKVEVTCPLISKKDKDNAIELNEKGYTSVEIGNLEIALMEIKEKTERIANKKNSKNTYDNTITLVIYLEDYIHFFDDTEICEDMLEQIKNSLKQIKYKFKNVYVLQNINNNKSLIKIM